LNKLFLQLNNLTKYDYKLLSNNNFNETKRNLKKFFLQLININNKLVSSF
jgi:hypothetical protein